MCLTICQYLTGNEISNRLASWLVTELVKAADKVENSSKIECRARSALNFSATPASILLTAYEHFYVQMTE